MRVALLTYALGAALPVVWVAARLWILRRLQNPRPTAEVIPFVAKHPSLELRVEGRAAGPVRNLFTTAERRRLQRADTYLAKIRLLRRSELGKDP